MIPLPDNMTDGDVGQWLSGAIFLARLNEQQEFVPVTFDHVTYDGRNRVIVARTASSGWLDALAYPIAQVRAHWPMIGAINVEPYRAAIHIERVPKKQYRRTLDGQQLRFVLPRQWELMKMKGAAAAADMRSLSPTVVAELHNPTYPTFEQALARLSAGWLSVALNPRIILAGDMTGKRMFYYRGVLAATVHGDKATPIADDLTVKLIDKATEGRYQWQT